MLLVTWGTIHQFLLSNALLQTRHDTFVIKTLVILSGLSPSGLGGPKSCSPSAFSKLYKKAGFRICCSTYNAGG